MYIMKYMNSVHTQLNTSLIHRFSLLHVARLEDTARPSRPRGESRIHSVLFVVHQEQRQEKIDIPLLNGCSFSARRYVYCVCATFWPVGDSFHVVNSPVSRLTSQQSLDCIVPVHGENTFSDQTTQHELSGKSFRNPHISRKKEI